MSTAGKRADARTAEALAYVFTDDKNITAGIVEDLVSANMVGESVHAKTVLAIFVIKGNRSYCIRSVEGVV